MVNKTIGSFRAALRKANGMTQEDVAQRVFVSNKTVSKWERNESSPDLALIPVLAELFGVTCDEILRGERGEKEHGNDEKTRLKTEKQMQRIHTHTINQFKSISVIAASLTILGLMCHFAVAYTYFKPLVAFGLGLAFLLGSIVLEIIQLIRANAALQDGAVPGEGSILPAATVSLLRRIAFAVLAFNAWAAILIWPMVAAEELDYVNGVLSLDAYLSQLPMQLTICLFAAALAAYFARHWLGFRINEKSVIATMSYKTGMIRRMAWMQAAFLLGLAALFFVPSLVYVLSGGFEVIGGILFLALIIVIFVVMVVTLIRSFRGSKDRLERLLVLLLSIRNIIFGVIIITVFNSINVYVSISPRPDLSFDIQGIPAALFQIFLITMVYLIVKHYLVRKQKGNENEQAVS